jgi:hypothetical protein
MFTLWSRAYRGSLQEKRALKIVWNSFPKYICWKVWLAHNNVMFNQKLDKFSKYINIRLIYDMHTLERVEEDWLNQLWIQKRQPFPSISKLHSHSQWQIRLEACEFLERRLNKKTFFLFFDGASKRNPTMVGVGGFSTIPEEKSSYLCLGSWSSFKQSS